MRRLAVLALLLADSLLPAAVLAEEFAFPGRGTIGLSVPSSWTLASKAMGETAYLLVARPRSGAAAVIQASLVSSSPDKPVTAAQIKELLEETVRPYLADSVEKKFAPKELGLRQGTGWMVQLTDASLVGKPPIAENYKVMRSVIAALDDHLLLWATLQFDDATSAEVGEAMALLSSLHFRRDAASRVPAVRAVGGAFEFTAPESRLLLMIPAIGLGPDPELSASGSRSPSYFILSRRQPQLIVSGWLEPASRYAGLRTFWESEVKSPAYSGAGAPQHVEFLRDGRWEVVSFDMSVPGGTSAHLRAERVQAGTWVDLHLSSTASRPPAALREELLGTLRSIEVVEK